MIVYDEQRRTLELGTVVGRGGEAVVYRIASQPNRLAKIYEPAPRPDYAAKLAWMITHPPLNPTREQSHPALAWPDGLLFDANGRLRGYGMPFIRRTTPVLDVFNPRRRAEVMPPYFDRRYLHRVARNLAGALHALHRSGYVAGDLNESNILVTHTALITLIDTDSFQVIAQLYKGSVTYPCPVGKLEYTAPELQGQRLAEVVRQPEQDSFGLAVLIFQLLMEGNHPFRAQWLAAGEPPPLEKRIAQGAYPYTASPTAPVLPPRNAPDLNLLNPWLGELLRRCFLDGHRSPALRPTPETWRNAIIDAEQHLKACPAGHYYSDHLRSCPTCAAREAAARTAVGGRPSAGRHSAGHGSGSSKAPSSGPQPARSGNPPPASPRSAPARGPQPAAARPANPFSPPNPASPSPAGVTGGIPPAAVRSAPSGNRSPAGSTVPAGGPSAASSATAAGSSTVRAASANTAAASRTPGSVFQQPRAPGRFNWRLRPAQTAGTPAGVSGGGSSAAATWLRGRGSIPLSWGRPTVPSWTRSTRRPLSQKLSRSLLVGGAYGALSGMLPGLIMGLVAGAASDPLAWNLLFAVGGATAGLSRGWQPGYRLAALVDRWIGWRRFWRGFGMVTGAVLGLTVGLVFAVAVFPVILGPLLGGRAGIGLGEKVWNSGRSLGWERIWAGLGAMSTAGFGWMVAGLLGASGASELGPNFVFALEYGGVRPLLTTILAGGFCSALGGLAAGILTDFVAGLLGLAD